MSITVSFSVPETIVPELFSGSDSYTLTLRTILAGMVLTAIIGSLRKKVRPPIVMFLTSLPLTLRPPLPTSMPGIFERSSPSLASSPTLNDPAL